MKHRIEIPNWLPASVNGLMRMDRHKRNRVLSSDAQMVAGYALQADLPHAAGKRRVTLTFAAPGGRGAKTGDADNRQKSCLDALVKCGALVDDSPAWVEVVVCCVRGPKSTTIELEDCEG